jgi:hypothetical protein
MSLAPWTWSPLRTLKNTLRTQTGNRRRNARRGPDERRSHLSEVLESRLMLTTLRGGDTFEYVDASGQIVRIALEGNIAAEFVGATVNGNNQAVAANLPGRVNGVDVFGGLGGPGGIDIIGRVSGLTADPDINAIAASATGTMYAFELQEIPVPNPPEGEPDTRHLVYLVQMSFLPVQPPPSPLPPPYGPRSEVIVTATRLAEISDEIIAESGGIFPAVNTLAAADFNPDNGLLYFVATGGENNFDKLFTINVTGSQAAIEASVNGIPGFFNDPGEDGIAVASIAFDQTSGGAQLVALMGNDQGGADGGGPSDVVSAEDPFIGVVSLANTDVITDLVGLTLFDPENVGGGGDDVPELSAIEILDDDPAVTDDLLALGPGASFRIVRDPADPFAVGTTIEFGPLEEPVPPGATVPDEPTGGAPSAIMFVPGMLDPFTGLLGAYVGFDQGEDSNDLFFVNRFEQLPVTIFQIYVASSDTTGRMAVARVPPLTESDRIMRPFEGDVGGVRHINAQNPGEFPWPVSQAGSPVGVVFVGARTRDLNPNDPNDDMRPLLTATIPSNLNLGLLPVGELPVDPDTGLRVVNAGATVDGDIDRMLIGGAITGDIIVNGSMNQLYAGWLLTGDALGEVQLAGPTRGQNFRVSGDLRDLYVLDSAGTDSPIGENPDRPTYITGFDLSVGGSVGNIRVGDMWVGNLDIQNRPDEDPTRGIDILQTEVEFRSRDNATRPVWDAFQFSGNPIFFNDTFDTPQYLGSINTLNQADMVRVSGLLQHTDANTINDWVDYYGVSLLAGQTVQVVMFSSGLPYVGVFDPDGRLIATEASDVGGAAGEVFQFTADRPGTYRFAVSLTGNFGFYNSRQVGTNVITPYEIRITGVGDLALGGMSMGTAMLDLGTPGNTRASYNVEFGDVGEIRTGTQMMSVDFAFGSPSTATVRVNSGNLRSLDGNDISFGTAAAPPANPDDPTDAGTAASFRSLVQVDVPAGSVGLVRARNPGGVLGFNFGPDGRPSIGGDYQLIDAASSLYVQLVADRGIGVIRAGDMATLPPSQIIANFDDNGRDGIIDLIDVTGNLGVLGPGGPSISTNTGGNVRYMRVGGVAFTDVAFGGGFGTPIQTLHTPGETVSLKDDSGTTYSLIPHGERRFSAIDPETGVVTDTLIEADALAIRSYPIRGSGGSVLLDVEASDSFTVMGGAGNPGSTAEIGRIIITGGSVGSGVVLDYSTNGPVFPSVAQFQSGFEPVNPGFGGNLGEPAYRRTPNPFILTSATPGANDPGGAPGDLDILIDGSIRVDVWDIVGVDTAINATDGKFTSIRNNTPGGELVNIRASSVGEIVSRGSIGISRSAVIPNLSLNPLAYYEDIGAGDETFPGRRGASTGTASPGYSLYYASDMGQFPYIDVRYGVWITGDLDENAGGGTQATALATPAEPGNVRSIRADQGVGNIVVNGSIGELFPNADGTREDGIFAGIQGIVWARGHSSDAFYGTPGLSGRPASGNALQDRGGDIWYVDIGEGIASSGSGSAIRSGIYAARRIDHVFGENADIRGNIIAGDEFESTRNRIVLPRGGGLGTVPGTGSIFRFVPNLLDFPDSIGRIQLKNGSIINANIGVVGEEFTSVEQRLRITLPEDPDPIKEPEFEIGRVTVSGNGGIIGTSFQAADIGLIDVNGGFGIFTSGIELAGEGVLGGIESDGYGFRSVLINAGGSLNFMLAHGDGTSVSTASFSPSVRRTELGYGGINADPLTGFASNTLTDIHAYLGTSAGTPEIAGRTDTGIMENIDVRGQRDLRTIRAQQIRALFPELLPSVVNFGNTVANLHVRDQINGLRMVTGRFGVFRPEGDAFNLDLTVAGQIKDLLIKGDLAENSVIRTSGSAGNMGNIRINGRLDGDILSSGKIKRLFVGEGINGNVVVAGARKGKALGELILGGDIAEGGLNIQGNVGRIVTGGDFGRTGNNFFVQGKVGSITIGGSLFSNIRVGSTLGKLTVGGSIISGSTIEARRIGSVRVGQDVQSGVLFRATRAPRIVTGGQMLGQIEIIP